MKRLIFLCLFFLNLNSQGQVIPRNKVDVKIKPIISVDTINNYFLNMSIKYTVYQQVSNHSGV